MTPVALVSGANRGIGRDVARQLRSEHGFLVLAGARDPDAIDPDGLVPIELDVADPASVDRARARIEGDPGGLDVLVNNAGVYGSPDGVAESDLDEAHGVFETNVFGAWRLIPAFLPLMRASAHPRLVNVSSGSGQLAEMGGGRAAYRQLGPHGHGRGERAAIGRGGGGHRGLARDAPGRWPHGRFLPRSPADPMVSA